MTATQAEAVRDANAGNHEPNSKAMVVTKAALNAAAILKLANTETAKVLGISPRTLNRIKNGETELTDTAQTLALYFIRVFRSLGALYGTNEEDMAKWIRANNSALRNRPIEVMQDIAGLVHTMDYLDRARAKV